MKQGNGIIKFFLVVLTLVCLLQYFYLLPTRGVESDAVSYAQNLANGDVVKERELEAEYLDSMSNKTVFSIPLLKDFTYQELKESQLALGLDLKGGMSVILQVDVANFLTRLADNPNDNDFKSAINLATERKSGSQSDYVTLFADAYGEIAGSDAKLAPIFASNETLREDMDYGASNGEVVQVLRTKAAETVNLTFLRLKDRIDELGVLQPNVSLDAARDLIVVELPGISNPERARKFLQSTAKLDFWEVYRISDAGILNSFAQADAKLKASQAGSAATEEFTITERWGDYKYDDSGNIIDSTLIQDTIRNQVTSGPLFQKLQMNGVSGGQAFFPYSVMGVAERTEMDEINAMLARPDIKQLFPPDLAFKWSAKSDAAFTGEDNPNSEIFQLYAIKRARGATKAPLQGDMIISASADPDPNTNEIAVSLAMNAEGARTWAQMTSKAKNDGEREIAILLDEKVVSAPAVRAAITDGRSSITGGFTLQEGQDLAKILQIGKLPADIEIIQEDLIGPSLGADNIRASIMSLIIGFALVLVFMMFYYGTGGIVSILALFLNVFFIFGSLASLGTVLTLPGIAGIVLTIGMAVDANVIIYERIREELREGKSLLMSISDGFRNSYTAIIDANVTTILTAFVLAYFGLGPIKGFAVVLIIGVLCSLFTAVLAGRLMIDYWTETKGNQLSFWTGASKNAFANLKIDWLGKRKIAYGISLFIIIAGIASFATKGFDWGIDFKGGYAYNIQFPEDVDVNQETLKTDLFDELGGSMVMKEVAGNNTFNLVTDNEITATDTAAATRVMQRVYNGVNKYSGGNIRIDDFKSPDGAGVHVTSSSKVGPTIAEDIKSSSWYAASFALILIFLYIFIRFNKWQFSMGAVAALFHDVAIVLSIFTIFHGILPFSLEVDQNFIAAILTVIGYSINDTVVVFDRIREYMNNYSGLSKHEVINKAINSTWSRTVITSVTTLFVVLILFIFGGGSIKGMAFALTVGIVVGTYSSVFIATPIMSDLSGEMEPKQAKKKSTFATSKV